MKNLFQVYKEMRERRPSSTMPSVELAEGTVANPSAAAAAAADSRGEGLDMTEEHGPSETTSLTKDDHQFLLSVDRGDIVTVHRLLDQKSVNVNCLDLLGRSALLIAIDNDNIEIVDLLLRYGAQIGDAILHAINEDNVEIVELLLANQQKNKKDLRGFFGGALSSSFTPDITPIILAAHRNSYKILKILLDRGDEVPQPHDVFCVCSDCIWKQTEDSLTHSRARINAYRALASPSFIALSSKDPILTAFQLSWELRRLSRLENEFKAEYEQLTEQCKDFAVALLNQVRTSKELQVILNFDPEESSAVAELGRGSKMSLSRLWLAVKYKQKKFVAHANCQQLLASIWYEGLPGFRKSNVALQLFQIASVGVLYPILSLLYMVAPGTRIGNFMRRPFVRFICHTASYLTFLCLLILDSLHIKTFLPYMDGNSTYYSHGREDIRGTLPTEIKCLIIVYVLGFVWVDMKCLWYEGLKSFVSDMWRIVDFITNALYITTFALNLVTYFIVQEELRRNDPAAFAPREEWGTYDPTIVAEGLFAAANIFSMLKLIHIFTINPHLGPMQIALGRMVRDVLKFLIIAMLVCFAFACGVNQLLSYYSQNSINRCEAKCQQKQSEDCSCDTSLANLFEITQSLYFAVYGLLDVKVFKLDPGHEFTQFVGKLMYGTYCAIMIVVLINMFIAMLSNSFEIISADVDTEWKFARSRLWMSFFKDSGTVLAPFNIIPTPKGVLRLLQFLHQKLCNWSKSVKVNRWLKIKKFLQMVREKDVEYQLVMHEIVTRYIRQSQQHTLDENISADDINEIKHDISSFRFEVLDMLKNIGVSPSNSQKTSSFRSMRNLRSSSDHRQVKHFSQSFPTRDCSLDGGSQSSADRASASVNDIHLESVHPVLNGPKSKGSEQANCDVGKPLDCSASGDSGIEIQEAIESSIIAQITDIRSSGQPQLKDLEVHSDDVPSEKTGYCGT